MLVSFTVRCSREATGLLKIYIREVMTGEERYFTSFEDAAAHMKRVVGEGDNQRGSEEL